MFIRSEEKLFLKVLDDMSILRAERNVAKRLLHVGHLLVEYGVLIIVDKITESEDLPRTLSQQRVRMFFISGFHWVYVSNY